MVRAPLILAAIALTAAAAVPHKVVRKTAMLDFSYVWPAEAAAIPALDSRLYADAKAKLAEAQKYAREDEALTREQKRDFYPHFFSMQWTTAGQTKRLLSLQSDMGVFTGGAHPNSNYGAMLWDRRLNRQVPVTALFSRSASLGSLTRAAYCKALDKERLKRREGERLEGEFARCPSYSELAIAPTDANKDGRFDSIALIASPYVAGPYVEGEYEVVLPVTRALLTALKPEYRASFEAQRQ